MNIISRLLKKNNLLNTPNLHNGMVIYFLLFFKFSFFIILNLFYYFKFKTIEATYCIRTV